MAAPIVLATALGLECRSLSRILTDPKPLDEGIWHGTEGLLGDVRVRIACTGVGPQRAARATEQIAATKPAAIIATGLAGALSAAIRPGTLILPHEIRAEHGGGGADEVSKEGADETSAEGNGEKTLHPAAELLATARASIGGDRISTTTGRLVSVAHPVTRPHQKHSLQKTSGAIAVDMESHAVLRVAEAHGVPALALRGVSDGSSDALPELGDADPERLKTQLAIAARALRRPVELRNLIGLALGTRRALQRLAAAHRALLPALARTLPPRY